jgi:hypothetical protein
VRLAGSCGCAARRARGGAAAARAFGTRKGCRPGGR